MAWPSRGASVIDIRSGALLLATNKRADSRCEWHPDGPRRAMEKRQDASRLSGQLRSDHPQLDLERADDFDHDVLRRRVEIAQPVHAEASTLVDLFECTSQDSHDLTVGDRGRCDRLDAASPRDGTNLAVRHVSQRDRAFGDGVTKGSPRVDQLVELAVERTKRRSDDGPVQ